MVDGIAGAGRGRIDAMRAAVSQGVARTEKPAAGKPVAAATASTAARLAAGGPPVDAEKIAAIRTAIAEGRYPVDPAKIAARMVELDLGPLA